MLDRASPEPRERAAESVRDARADFDRLEAVWRGVGLACILVPASSIALALVFA